MADETVETIPGVVRVDDVETALAVAETELSHRMELTRAHASVDEYRAAEPAEALPLPTYLIVSGAAHGHTDRLRAVLELGRKVGMVGIVMGDWADTVTVAPDGTITEIRGVGLGRPLWEMQPHDADTYFGKVLRDAKPSTRTGRAAALTVYFQFLELRHKIEIHNLTGRVIECPLDEMNRPRASVEPQLRIPPNEAEIEQLFAGWREELLSCRKFAPAARTSAGSHPPARTARHAAAPPATPPGCSPGSASPVSPPSRRSRCARCRRTTSPTA